MLIFYSAAYLYKSAQIFPGTYGCPWQLCKSNKTSMLTDKNIYIYRRICIYILCDKVVTSTHRQTIYIYIYISTIWCIHASCFYGHGPFGYINKQIHKLPMNLPCWDMLRFLHTALLEHKIEIRCCQQVIYTNSSFFQDVIYIKQIKQSE